MAARRALVLIGGIVQELPDGDTLEGAGAGFRDAPDETDYSDAAYFYFGWENEGGGDWLVRRQARADASAVDAERSAANDYDDLDAAWAQRASLSYS